MQPELLKAVLLLLYQVQVTITPTQFRELFGEPSPHLWHRFVTGHDYNLVEFYANLDPDKKNVLIQYLSNYNRV